MLSPLPEEPMFRALARFVLIIVVVVAAAAFFMGYRWGGVRTPRITAEPAVTRPVGTAGRQADERRGRAGRPGAGGGGQVRPGARKAQARVGEARLPRKGE